MTIGWTCVNVEGSKLPSNALCVRVIRLSMQAMAGQSRLTRSSVFLLHVSLTVTQTQWRTYLRNAHLSYVCCDCFCPILCNGCACCSSQTDCSGLASGSMPDCGTWDPSVQLTVVCLPQNNNDDDDDDDDSDVWWWRWGWGWWWWWHACSQRGLDQSDAPPSSHQC